MDVPLNIDVAALDLAHRQAFEDVVGRPLQSDERLIIQVATSKEAVQNERASHVMNLLTHFYDGMSDEEIEEIDRTIKTRADLGRPLPRCVG